MKTSTINEIEKLVNEINNPRRENTKKFLVEARDGARALYSDKMRKLVEDAGFNSYDLSRRGSEASAYKNKLIEEFGTERFKLGTSLFHTDIEKLVEKEFDAKEAKMIAQINKKLQDDDELISVNTVIADNGYLDGVISLKEASIKITTIVAWGDIQRPHYRTLVKRTK